MTSTALMVARSALLAAACGFAFPAWAQWDRPNPYSYNRPPPPYGAHQPEEMRARPLPPDVVTDRLEDRGYDDVSRPRFDGSVYIVEATNLAGQRERLLIDAFRGHIVQRTALSDPRRRRPDDEDEWTLPDPPPGARYGALPEGRPVRPSPDYDAPAGRGPAPGPDVGGSGRALDIGPVESRPLAPPADSRLAPTPTSPALPSANVQRAPSPTREASRPPPAAPPSGELYGVNPERAAPKPRAPAAVARPPPPAGAPAKPDGAGKPAEARPAATADAGPRKPVRVIEGVTRMDGGAQSTPGPQNGLQGTKPGQ